MKLLPKNRDHGWAPYTWLVYYVFFLINPILNHAGWKEWLATGLGSVAFLALYFSFFWFKRPWNLLNIAGMVLLGLGFAPFNGGACTFFVFAAAFIPFAVEKESTALKLLAAVLAVVSLEWWLLHLSGWFLFYGGGLASVICVGNVYFDQPNLVKDRV
jgi:two-component system sensor histidine kinase DesK